MVVLMFAAQTEYHRMRALHQERVSLDEIHRLMTFNYIQVTIWIDR